MLARFTISVASAIRSFTVYSTLSVLSNLRATELNARSAASSAVPLDISMPIPCRVESLCTLAVVLPCTCFTFNSLAVLFKKIVSVLSEIGLPHLPRVERIVLEHFQHCHDDLRAFSKDTKSLFSAASEYTISARCPKSINYVGCHTEWNTFWHLENLPLCRIGAHVSKKNNKGDLPDQRLYQDRCVRLRR